MKRRARGWQDARGTSCFLLRRSLLARVMEVQNALIALADALAVGIGKQLCGAVG
jgi:hypothetical protein